MRLRELYDRFEACRKRYWDIPKGALIVSGLRPDTGAFGYSGNVIVDLASDLLAKTLRGNYPVAVDTMQAFSIFGEDRQFGSATEILAAVESMIIELESRLAACEATLK